MNCPFCNNKLVLEKNPSYEPGADDYYCPKDVLRLYCKNNKIIYYYKRFGAFAVRGEMRTNVTRLEGGIRAKNNIKYVKVSIGNLKRDIQKIFDKFMVFENFR